MTLFFISISLLCSVLHILPMMVWISHMSSNYLIWSAHLIQYCLRVTINQLSLTHIAKLKRIYNARPSLIAPVITCPTYIHFRTTLKICRLGNHQICLNASLISFDFQLFESNSKSDYSLLNSLLFSGSLISILTLADWRLRQTVSSQQPNLH